MGEVKLTLSGFSTLFAEALLATLEERMRKAGIYFGDIAEEEIIKEWKPIIENYILSRDKDLKKDEQS